jgi:hypothetical protein
MMESQTFWSKSPTAEQRSLSNFAKSPVPISIDVKLCHECRITYPFEGTFDCIEAVYVAGKYASSVSAKTKTAAAAFDSEAATQAKAQRQKAIQALSSAGSCGSGPAAKRMGGKGVMLKTYGLVLEKRIWDGIRGQSYQVMKMAVAARAKVDTAYAALLQKAVTNKFTWLHLEPRAGIRAFWGGSFHPKTREWQGKNILGRLLFEVASKRATAILQTLESSSTPSSAACTTFALHS